LEVEGDVKIGVVTRPVMAEVWRAVRGRGAFCSQGSTSAGRFRVSKVQAISEARVTLWPPTPGPMLDALRAAATWVQPNWSLLKNLLEGNLDVIVTTQGAIWDHAPPVLFTLEAGGRFSDHSGGSRLDAGGGIYSNGLLNAQIQALLADL
jgi:histidinol-phosphatase